MKVPDYISPIVGYRVWQWDAAGLKSLNGEAWSPGRQLAARCRVAIGGGLGGRVEAVQNCHQAPQTGCTCGIYAAKTVAHLRGAGYERYGICGEVCLWGTVVEHEHGWRAQFAYPKRLFLPPDALPFTLAETESRLQALTAYAIAIFMFGQVGKIRLWEKESGYDQAGLDLLIKRCSDWYDRRERDRSVQAGDRVAILGRGIAVVEQANDQEVNVVLWNKRAARIPRKHVVWNRQNSRWESEAKDAFETSASR